MKGKLWRIVRPSAPLIAPLIFLFLVVLTLAATPVAAQARPSCKNDAYVMGWDEDAASGTGFTMTRDCDIKTGNAINPLLVKSGKTFIIDGAGFTIYAADKASANDQGTAITLASGAGTLVLRNVTIEGGGDAATPTGGDPDPAIIVNGGTLILDGATIQNTRGGAIRVVANTNAIILLKNAKFIGNQITVTGNVYKGSAITANSGRIYIVGLMTFKNNVGGRAALRTANDATVDLYDTGCFDISGNQDSGGTGRTISIETVPAGFATIWNGKPRTSGETPCTASTASTTNRPQGNDAPPTIPAATSTATVPAAPANGGGSGGGQMTTGAGMAMPSLADDGRISGMIDSASAYFLVNRGGVLVLRIYRVDSDSVGHWVMDVSQVTVDAMAGAGCVAASPDGRYAVRVWADGNVTVSNGPNMESKIFHNTLRGGLTPAVISTDTTYSSTPPGVGCPGYIG